MFSCVRGSVRLFARVSVLVPVVCARTWNSDRTNKHTVAASAPVLHTNVNTYRNVSIIIRRSVTSFEISALLEGGAVVAEDEVVVTAPSVVSKDLDCCTSHFYLVRVRGNCDSGRPSLVEKS